MPMLRLLWLAVLALWMNAAAAQFVPVPELKGRVNDNANMLSPDQRAQLEAVLADYEQQAGSQIVILTVPKTEPEAIEQYAIRVVEQWKIGRKGVDDGVLLLVAKDNPASLRRLRIEAGRGVQGVLTDAQSKRILQDVIAPHFRQNQFYDGMVAGVSAIAALLKQEQLPAPQRQAQQQQQDEGTGSWPFLLFIALVAMSMMRSRGGRYGRVRRGGWASGATGFILGNAIGSMTSGRGGHIGGGWGGGGGFGGGGFSGGGGTFDGGGASGDW